MIDNKGFRDPVNTPINTNPSIEVMSTGYIGIAKLLQIQRDYSESIPYLERVIQADPKGGPGFFHVEPQDGRP